MNIMKCIDHVDVDRNWYLMVMRDHNGTGEKNLITFLLKVFEKSLNFQIYSNSLKKMAPLKKVLLIEFSHSWFQLSDIWREIRLYTGISKMKI